ncbi:Flp pilus assembly complex ATPase component TadA [Patescibacteria group bacterium]|nr:Flp pilus assembly complex ATPase component TadA [Patescibacteria group bacterium]MBU1907727.1 Flp pilus assembly complex ATPase component TadA [Patescibacteria group bacterium]
MSEKIISLLRSKGLIDEKAAGIIAELVKRGKTLEQAAIGGRYVSDIDFAKVKAETLGLPFVDLSAVNVSQEAIELLPLQVITNYRAIPIGFDGRTLQVAMENASDIKAQEALQFLANEKKWKLQIVVVPSVQIAKLLRQAGGGGGEVESALAEAKGKFAKQRGEAEEISSLEELIKGAPVSRMVSVIMRQAVDGGASDIHIEPMGGESRVRYRIDGVLRTSLALPLYIHPAVVSRIKVLANMKLDETRIPQDGRITEEINGKKIDFRVSTLPVVDNEKVVMRILDTSLGAPTFEQLGYREEYIALIKEEIKRPFGLFLITGPTGSGKSTTLFSGLNLLNGEGVNISTLEDPVEYYIAGVNQSQIRPDIGYTFATGLRSLLRQDPNVIMVGEIRDKETAELAIHASLTGHLIFSTIHTNDVFGLVPRLIDIGVEPFLLAATLNIGIAQRLARKICPHCKAEQEIAPETLQKLQRELGKIPPKYLKKGFDNSAVPVFYHGKGCARCGGSGYSGRTAVAELFQFTPQAKRSVERGFPIEEVQAEADRQGMLRLRQDVLLKALEGTTTVEEVLRLGQETTEGE